MISESILLRRCRDKILPGLLGEFQLVWWCVLLYTTILRPLRCSQVHEVGSVTASHPSSSPQASNVLLIWKERRSRRLVHLRMAKTAFDSLARSVHGESLKRDIENQLELSLLMALKVICSRFAASLYKTTRAWNEKTKWWLPNNSFAAYVWLTQGVNGEG